MGVGHGDGVSPLWRGLCPLPRKKSVLGLEIRIDHIRNDNNLPPADLWRRAVSRGHRVATLRPLLAKR